MGGCLFYLITCNDEIQTFPIPTASLGTRLWFPFGRGGGKRQSRRHLVMSGWRKYLKHLVASTQVLADTLHRAAATWAPKRITALTGIVNGPTRSIYKISQELFWTFNQIHAHSLCSVDDQSIGHGVSVRRFKSLISSVLTSILGFWNQSFATVPNPSSGARGTTTECHWRSRWKH